MLADYPSLSELHFRGQFTSLGRFTRLTRIRNLHLWHPVDFIAISHLNFSYLRLPSLRELHIEGIMECEGFGPFPQVEMRVTNFPPKESAYIETSLVYCSSVRDAEARPTDRQTIRALSK